MSLLFLSSKKLLRGGRHSTEVAFTLTDPAAPGSIPGVLKIFPRNIVDVAKVN